MQITRICQIAAAPVAEADDAIEQRLALTRMLVWAEQESMSLGCDDAAAHLRAAVRGLQGSD